MSPSLSSTSYITSTSSSSSLPLSMGVVPTEAVERNRSSLLSSLLSSSVSVVVLQLIIYCIVCMNLKVPVPPDCLRLLVGRTSLEEVAAGHTLLIDWASAASLAFLVRIRFRGPDTDSMGVRTSCSITGYQRRSGRCIESNYSLRQSALFNPESDFT